MILIVKWSKNVKPTKIIPAVLTFKSRTASRHRAPCGLPGLAHAAKSCARLPEYVSTLQHARASYYI